MPRSSEQSGGLFRRLCLKCLLIRSEVQVKLIHLKLTAVIKGVLAISRRGVSDIVQNIFTLCFPFQPSVILGLGFVIRATQVEMLTWAMNWALWVWDFG